jgi:hypothetical protein
MGLSNFMALNLLTNWNCSRMPPEIETGYTAPYIEADSSNILVKNLIN